VAHNLLLFETDAASAEPLTDTLLALDALSVTTEDAAAGTAGEQAIFDEPGETATWPRLRLRVLLAADTDARALLERACAAAGVAPPQDLRLEAVEERDWVRETQAQFDPIRISARLWIVPSWHKPPAPPAIAIALDPGVAFGTGSHPTTKLCLRWLEQQVRGGETVLDYGCGSGILAIAAMKLGAARAVGVDIDPAAVGAAAENATRNDVACEFSDSRVPLAIEADLIVANILANPLKLLAPLLAARVRAGGRIALSGILEQQSEEVERSYASWFAFETPQREDGWVCLSGVRQARLS
jgi:ribosomal protein L11 methyltransferase